MDASHATGWRLFCDACSAPVANMHRSCWACEVDVCVECCADTDGVESSEKLKPVAALASTLVMKKGNGGGDGEGGEGGRRRKGGGGGGGGGGGNVGVVGSRTGSGSGIKPREDRSDRSGRRPSPSRRRPSRVRVRVRLGLGVAHAAQETAQTRGDGRGVSRSEPDPNPDPTPTPTRTSAPSVRGRSPRPCAEPLLCASCTRPLDLRSCVDRAWLDAVYDSPHVAAAEAEDARGDARDVERSYERSDEKKSDRARRATRSRRPRFARHVEPSTDERGTIACGVLARATSPVGPPTRRRSRRATSRWRTSRGTGVAATPSSFAASTWANRLDSARSSARWTARKSRADRSESATSDRSESATSPTDPRVRRFEWSASSRAATTTTRASRGKTRRSARRR